MISEKALNPLQNTSESVAQCEHKKAHHLRHCINTYTTCIDENEDAESPYALFF